MKISVIVIAKNEEIGIKRCYSSIKEACKSFSHEIIFVDSNSSDNTLEEMRKILISNENDTKVIQLKSNFYTAALARNIGAKNSQGEWLIFLDGDMELDKKFINSVLSGEKTDDKIIGYVGERDDLFYDETGKVYKRVKNVYSKNNKVGPAKKFGGALMIYKKSFDELSGYNSKLKTNEEMEFYSRILSMDKIIYYTDQKMIEHNIKYGKKTLLGKFFNLRYIYTGQALRSGSLNRNFLALNYSLYVSLSFWIFVIVFISTLGLFKVNSFTLFLGFIALYLLIRLFFITKFKPIDFLKNLFNSSYAFFGFLLPLKNLRYTYEVIKENLPSDK